MGAQLRNRRVDGAIAELAARQHGVVGRAQLIELGLGRRAIGHRLGWGRLHAVHRGVYAVGHRVLSAEARWMAAVLAVGPGAVLSHRSAAALWGMRQSMRVRTELTVGRHLHSRPRLQLHWAQLPSDEVTNVRGIPVTTPPRTLLDLAAVIDRSRLERAVNEAELLRLADALSLAAVVARHPRRPGVAKIKAILAAGAIGATVTRSELEDRFLEFVDAARLPRPNVNARLQVRGGWIEADCVWAPQRLVAELDGHATHRTAGAYERDRARDRALSAAGWRVVRITWRQLSADAAALAADLRALLGVEGQLGPSGPRSPCRLR